MPRGASISDRHEALAQTQREVSTELERLRREEEYLILKVRQAREQVRYYEELLDLLRRDWGQTPGLSDLVRKLG
ncbi:MAG: hypothetical protein ABSB97_05595 [Thermoplasmata archaeon]|jgi:hypothetical protein